ncbi:2OG-Fe(II)-dependent halogenase WelO5 family protein [Streptacidiphilus cavernicola]|uniref:Prolyl 4-hydroxylase alpha subunit Fe(2+) 2OG dioxygenase domain-containing protein n=1 Tax=Streptacidiphilus cavernicola TaxID=3342716 RepID=A0ABV6VYU3_9ACTN
MQSSDSWDRVVIDAGATRPDFHLLRDLVHGDVAVVVLRNLLPAQVFSDNLARLGTLFDSASTTAYANGSLTTVGPYLAKYLDRLDDYFTAAKEADARLGDVSFDLAEQVRTALREGFGLTALEPAREPDGREYAPSVVRIHADGVRNPLHNDNIMRDAAGTGIVLAELAHQLSCVVCLQECDEGGELKIYRKSWEPEDEQHKVPGHLGYRQEAVSGAACHAFKPRAGDVYLINPTRFHEIERVSGSDRLTMGFFLGFASDRLDSAVVWG